LGLDSILDALYRNDAPDETVRADGRDDARAEAVKTGTLDALAEMRGAGMNFIRRLDKRAAGQMDETELAGMARVGDDCVAFERMARAVRQIIALEQETVGIRPMPQPGTGGGSSGRRQDGDDTNDNPARPERLRTGSTRGARNDLKDRRYEEDAVERKEAFVAAIARVDGAAKLDLAAAGLAAEAAAQSPLARITVMIYAVPRPHFEACLQAMSLEPLHAGVGAMIRGSARPGVYKLPQKPP
jgi:hypothetical protein